MRRKTYIIEARRKGELVFDVPDPSTFFGTKAIHGLSDDEMAQPIFRRIPDAVLDGGSIPNWPKLIHPDWVAREKTW